MRKAAHQRGAVERLELVELGAIDEARNHLARIVLFLKIERNDAVELGRIVGRLGRRAQRNVDPLQRVEIGDDAAGERQRMMVIGRVVVGNTRPARVHVGAAQLLGRNLFPGRGAHQGRAAEKDRSLVAHDDGLVRHGRHIGAARRARAHHHGDLRDAGCRERCLIVEDAAEVLAVRKHLGLMRQVGAAGIDQIDARQPVLARDFLRAQVFLHRHGKIGAALDGRVVAHDHALAALDAADPGDHAGAVDGVVIKTICGERRELQKRRAGVEQGHDAIARQQLAARDMPLSRARRSAQRGFSPALVQLVNQRRHGSRVGTELGARAINE